MVRELFTRRLYVSHSLYACSTLIFEFDSVLYLASIFPGTLLPTAVYAMVRSALVIVFSSPVGQYIDREDRFQVVRLSIVLQRTAVAASCIAFLVLGRVQHATQALRAGLLALIVVMACAEKLATMMNLIAVDSQMRRIDLICKLFGPFFIRVVSVVVEYYSIAEVHNQVPELQQPKSAPSLVLTVTYLLATGYTSTQTATTRIVSMIFEVFATWVGSWLMARIGPVSCLTVGMSIFWKYADDNNLMSTLGLVGGIILSRVGLWGFDLSYILLFKTSVTAVKLMQRFVGLFRGGGKLAKRVRMCSYTLTIVLSSPSQFQWPATISVGAVFCAWALYRRLVRIRRSNLIHWPASISHPE
ncbi:Ferroporti-1 [Dactylonectria estremocensis]|uniref:Solute carrier family 40 member n=1 Tax=Dactylonectria estremocensis TaxID=1079267 RepID=A0A9P9F1N6_9HYPO|nr:Ferroporti-1 [Dactylonectria estremocensis]